MTNDLKSITLNYELVQRFGRVERLQGLSLESVGPDVGIGELCEIESFDESNSILAEVVGFRDKRVVMMPYQDVEGIKLSSRVSATGRTPSIPLGKSLIGRVVNAFGEPIDNKGGLLLSELEYQSIFPGPINPLERCEIREQFFTGINLLDTFISMGKGQRLGILAGSGVGKSTLVASIASKATSDINVIALIGERGREVIEFVNETLGETALAKSVVVVATADESALMRSRAAFTATAIAEYFSKKSKDVLLLMDSITRLAIAQRDIGLASGELPSMRGYTPSCFTILPKLIERAGSFQHGGSITGVYSVLVEGDDFNEPITDNLRAILDGHIVLSRKIANQGVFPAIDLLSSLSRLKVKLTGKKELQIHDRLKSYLAQFESSRDLIEIGAYKQGDNLQLDKAIVVYRDLNELIKTDQINPMSHEKFEIELLQILSKIENSSEITKKKLRPIQ